MGICAANATHHSVDPIYIKGTAKEDYPDHLQHFYRFHQADDHLAARLKQHSIRQQISIAVYSHSEFGQDAQPSIYPPW
jgi:hypothetical protein